MPADFHVLVVLKNPSREGFSSRRLKSLFAAIQLVALDAVSRHGLGWRTIEEAAQKFDARTRRGQRAIPLQLVVLQVPSRHRVKGYRRSVGDQHQIQGWVLPSPPSSRTATLVR